jgi:hypothetical protein
VGAADVRVLAAPVRRTEELTEAIVTHRQIRRYSRRRTAVGSARSNLEVIDAGEGRTADIDARDHGRPRKSRPELARKRVDRIWRSLDVDLHSNICVDHPPGQPVRLRQPEDERSKSDTLHDSPDS